MNAKQNPTTGTRRPLTSAPGRAGRSRTTRSWVIVAIVGLVLSIAPPAIAHEVVPGVDGEAIRTLVEENMDEFDIPGLALVVVKGSEIALLEGFGLADPENGIQVDPNETVFRIASVSKPLTALAVLRAASDGLLDLDADINTYLDFTVDDFDGTSATSAAILTHTAGFEDRAIGSMTQDPEAIKPLSDWVPSNVPARLAATGDAQSYSNHAYALVGHVLERATGVDFLDYTQTKLFEPLGMGSTTFDAVEPDGAAVGYLGTAGNRTAEEMAYLHNFPAGGAFTTANDMGKLIVTLLGFDSDVITADMRSAMLEPSYRPLPEVPGRTAGGLVERSVTGTRVVGHAGDIGTFGAEMWLVPDEGIGFFFAFNAVDLEFSNEVVTGLLDLLVGVDPGPQPAEYSISSEVLDEYAGSYRWTRFGRSQADKILALTPPYNLFVAANDDLTLTLEMMGVAEQWVYRPINDSAFIKISGDRVMVNGLPVDPGDRIGFTRDESGDVAYVHLSQELIAAEKTPGFLMGIAQLAVLGSIVLLFALGLAAWPIGAWVRRRKAGTLSDGERWIRRLALTETGLVVTALVALIIGIMGTIQFGMPPMAILAVTLFTLAAVVGLGLIPAAVLTWVRGWLTLGERVVLSILALTTPMLLWWTIYWNVFGYQF
jgi:CubicO group peptidase (beta-lactamase class C family)